MFSLLQEHLRARKETQRWYFENWQTEHTEPDEKRWSCMVGDSGHWHQKRVQHRLILFAIQLPALSCWVCEVSFRFPNLSYVHTVFTCHNGMMTQWWTDNAQRSRLVIPRGLQNFWQNKKGEPPTGHHPPFQELSEKWPAALWMISSLWWCWRIKEMYSSATSNLFDMPIFAAYSAMLCSYVLLYYYTFKIIEIWFECIPMHPYLLDCV